MIESLKSKYLALNHKKQIRVKQAIGVIVVALLMYFAYESRVDGYQEMVVQNELEQVKEVPITNAELFENDISDEVDEKLLKTQQELKNLKELFELSLVNNETEKEASVTPENTLLNNKPGWINYDQNYPIPNDNTALNQGFNDNPEGVIIQPQWIGGIVHEEYEPPLTEKTSSAVEEKKRIIKLPPSFMEGFLLTGMDAMTVEGSDDVPEPVMIRVQAPAVLPNEVKANLKGCFVIAEGYGSLATHRVDARLRSLSCVDFQGGSVIHEKISGYVQDEDGKRGIKGQVVHRAGAMLARSMIAGAFQGLGDAMTASTQTNNLSSIGQTVTTPSANLSTAAFGGGVSSAAKDVRSLFLQLAKQSSPVVEVGAAKKVSVVITELVELHIEDL